MAKAAELDEGLVAGLKAAKSKRAYFALVLKGSKDGALIVSKTKVPPATIAAAKKQSGGSAVLKGFCRYEDGTYIFETAKDAPATAAQAVKQIVKRDAGLTVKAEFRLSTDPELAADEGDATAPVAPVAPADGADVIKRLNAMSADIKAALAGPNKARVQALFVAVGGQIKSKDFVQAGKGLDELEPLLKPSAGGATTELVAEWKAKLAEWTPAFKAALAAKGPRAADIAKLLTQASGLAKPGGDIIQAISKLTECYDLTTQEGKGVAQNSMQTWIKAKDQADADINRLCDHLNKTGEEALREAAAKLATAMGMFKVDLTSSLMNVDQASGEKQRLLYDTKVVPVIEKYKKALLADQLLTAAEKNPFVPVSVKKPLLEALSKIQKKLNAKVGS